MPKFVKGQIANPNGRPVGSKDKKYLNLQYWFSMLEEELNRTIHVKEFFKDGTMYREYDRPAVEPNTRARLFIDGMKMLISKMANLPKDSEESINNANQLMEEMKQLEANFGRSGEIKSDKSGVDTGTPKI
jgi:hypothetical protein